jgi:UDP-N-acetylglucosamine 3-dehydrogenase
MTMVHKAVTLGIAGLGLGRYFLDAAVKNDGVGSILLCDKDPSRLDKAQKENAKVTGTFTEFPELLQKGKPDAVCIVTPDHFHKDHAAAAFKAGCHVLLTKPIACIPADAKAIIRASRKAGKKLMVAHEARFRPVNQAILKAIRDGLIGDLIHLRLDSFHDKRGHFAASPWYASPEAGRTAMAGTGIHEVDLLRVFTGKKIEKVLALENSLGTLKFPRAKTVSALFGFEGGAIGQVTVTYEARYPEKPEGVSLETAHCVILGTRGMIIGDRVVSHDRPEAWRPLSYDRSVSPMAHGLAECTRRFIRSVLDNTEPPVTGEDALASLSACAAADEAAQSLVK